jgi:hypothetical protein
MSSNQEFLGWYSPRRIFAESELRWGDSDQILTHRDTAAEKMVKVPLYLLGAAAVLAFNRAADSDSIIVNGAAAISALCFHTAAVLSWAEAAMEARTAHFQERPGECLKVASQMEPELPPLPPREAI